MNELENNYPLFLFWGLVLILTSVRLYFYEPFKIPLNSNVKLEANAENVNFGERYQRVKIANITVFAPLYPKIAVGDVLTVDGKVDAEGRMFDPTLEIVGHEASIQSYLWNFRNKIAGNIEALLPPREATLVVGTLLGIDSIGEDFRQELTKTGTIHVVVVSGQNLAIVAGIFLSFVKYLGRRTAVLFSAAACLLYALLVGFEPPVVRALLMVFVSTLALYFGRASTSVLSLFIAALVIISVWPESISSISFQLTFAATLGIITLGNKLQKIIKIPVFGEVSSVCIGAFVFTAPLILFYFGQVSLLSPLVNILVSEAIFPVMVLGFAVSVMSLIFMPGAQVLAYIVAVPAKYFVEVVGLFAKLDAGTIDGFSTNILAFSLSGLFFLLTFLIWRKSG